MLPSGKTQFRLLSPVMAYSVCLYGGTMGGLWVAHSHEARAQQYDDYTTALYHLVLLLLVIFIPFTYWRDAPTLAHYISTWPRFQVPTVTVANIVVTS
jgi:hypothetical protein